MSTLKDFEKQNKEIVDEEYVKLLQEELRLCKKELDSKQEEVAEWKYNYEVEIPRQVMILEANKKLQKELNEAVELIRKLSKVGDGTHKDKKASYYDCLPTLQLEFEERLELAKEFLAKVEKDN